MNSKQQYIDLFRDNRTVIEAGSAPVLNCLRDEAAESLRSHDLPLKGTEGYERTDVNGMFAPDYGLNIMRLNLPADIAEAWKCDVPNISTLFAVVANDSFIPSSGLETRLPEGVIFTSLRQAALSWPDLVGKYYGTVAPVDNAAVALNTMLVQDGVFIYIPRGLRLPRPLQLVNIFSAPASMMALRRVLIVMEEDSEAQILVCDHTQDTANSYLSSEVVEIHLSPKARLDYYCIEESSEATTRHSQMFVNQGDESSFLTNISTLTCGNTRNSFTINVNGQRCETRLAGMAIATGRMHIDNSVQLRHLAPKCYSNQLFKYVADDNATGAFQGLIYVSPEAPFTDAYQTCRSVLASPDARMHAKPQLEIYNDEVKCSHGSTTGQLDAKALFYMRTRGIPENQARTMLMQAFMADVIDTVKMEGLHDRLRHLVEKRFAGDNSLCGECRANCRDASSNTNE